jgi:formylglycine-generating enzyme required for sulfatase activity
MKNEKTNIVKADKTKRKPARVLRGGGWFYDTWGVRVSLRDRFNVSFRGDFQGFRLVLQEKKK